MKIVKTVVFFKWLNCLLVITDTKSARQTRKNMYAKCRICLLKHNVYTIKIHVYQCRVAGSVVRSLAF